MPIANLLIRPERLENTAEVGTLIKQWSADSGISDDHMTANFVPMASQAGAPCDAMAFLYLPSLWSEPSIDALQLGLATALSKWLDIPVQNVQVITSIVPSGRVVSDGETETW